MIKWQFVFTALLASSCAEGDEKDPSQEDETPTLIAATQSVSLEFPLHFDAGDSPPGYLKETPKEAGAETGQHLIGVIVMCSPDIAWIEKTSHTISVILPSDENAIWEGVNGWRPSDEDIIECIKQSARQPFFYRKLPTGIETYAQK